MRVKVGETWYSSEDFPLMVQLSARDKLAINNMDPACDRYAMFQKDDPKLPTNEARLAWMDEGYKAEWNKEGTETT